MEKFVIILKNDGYQNRNFNKVLFGKIVLEKLRSEIK